MPAMRLILGALGRRVVTPSPPRRFTSLNAAAYARLVNAGGGGDPEARTSEHDERLDVAPVRAERDGSWLIGSCRHLPGRSLVKKSTPRRGSACASRHRRGAAESRARRAARRGCPRSCRGRRAILRELLGEQLRRSAPSAMGYIAHQRVVRRLRDRGVHRCARRRVGDAGVAAVALRDRVDGVEDRDVDDGHRPARAARPELLAEDSRIAFRRPACDRGPRESMAMRFQWCIASWPQDRAAADARAPRFGRAG